MTLRTADRIQRAMDYINSFLEINPDCDHRIALHEARMELLEAKYALLTLEINLPGRL